MPLEHEELTGKIIAAAICVHKELGPGFVELKAVKQITDTHFAFVRSYLRAVDRKHGLILNFAKPTLEIKRAMA